MMGVLRFGGVMGEVTGKDENYGAICKYGSTKLDCVRNRTYAFQRRSVILSVAKNLRDASLRLV
jgi:hypothetical protein